MIGRPEWFTRRKYSGWGIFPKTWQGWIYIAIVILPFAIFQAMPYWSQETRMIVTVVWLAFLLIDIVDIMIRMNKDEREKIHEAISERNALWMIMLVLVIGLLYQIITSSLAGKPRFDWLIVLALLFGVAVKAISNVYLDRKD